MMKFTGLILMCAASSLALLLPAMGVVHFPMTNPSSLSQPANALPPSGLAVAVPGSSPADSPGDGVEASRLTTESVPSLLGPPWTKQKLGLNAWLLLGPVLLLGLGLWTFGPNRGGLGRRTGD
jgi:hypothetical protein